MEQEIHITLRYNLAIGKVNLNEIVYRLKELRDPLMLKVLELILLINRVPSLTWSTVPLGVLEKKGGSRITQSNSIPWRLRDIPHKDRHDRFFKSKNSRTSILFC